MDSSWLECLHILALQMASLDFRAVAIFEDGTSCTVLSTACRPTFYRISLPSSSGTGELFLTHGICMLEHVGAPNCGCAVDCAICASNRDERQIT